MMPSVGDPFAGFSSPNLSKELPKFVLTGESGFVYFRRGHHDSEYLCL